MKKAYLFERNEHLKKYSQQEYKLADIWDRLAAFVVDFLAVGVLANLFCAPLKKKLQAAYLAESDGVVIYIILGCILISFLTFVFYHTLQLFFFQKTIGKKLFKVEVAHILPNQKISFWSYLLRSIYLFFSIMLFTLPLLEVFSNPLRRPLHDRLADTYVKGLYRQMAAPNIVENMWVKLVLMVFAANVFIFFSAVFYFEQPHTSFFSEILVPDEYVCEEVSAEYDSNESFDHTRLALALMLYSADKIDKNCLEMEAQRAIMFNEEMDNAYLAKAFVYEDQYELSNEYLAKICEDNSEGEACFVSKIVDLWNAKKWDEATKMFQTSNFSKGFSQIWAIKHFDRIQDHDEVLKIVNSLFPNRMLSDFLSEYKTFALKSSNKNEVAGPLFESVYETLSDEARLQFVVQSCYRDLENTCGNSPKSCQLLLKDVDIPYHIPDEESLVVTSLKAARCGQGDLDELIADFRNRIEDPELQLFMAATKAETLNKISVSQQIYKSILKKSGDISMVNYETRLRLLDISLEDSDLEEQIQWWMAEKQSPYHKSFTKKLMAKLIQDKKWQLADTVATEISKVEGLAKELKESLMVVFYENKKIDLAKKYLAPKVSQRSIASQNRAEEISKALLEISERKSTKVGEP